MSQGGRGEEHPLWVHPLAEFLPDSISYPLVNLPDGSLGCIDGQGFRISEDDGWTWSGAHPVADGINPKEPGSCHLLRTDKGTLLVVYLNFRTYCFCWDERRKEPGDDCRLEVWAARSADNGTTWTDHQRILGGYNPNFFGLIQTGAGRIVVPLQHLTSDPGRLIACSFYSDDDGKTWKRSNWIDLGGHGHHDGAFEPTVAELSDGRLLMLLRTSWDRFWQAISDDGGRYWRTILPSTLDASNSPGYLLRLRSGRLLLVWNRLHPEGRMWEKTDLPQHTEIPSSWHREELSLAFSQDDGKSWTEPIVIVRQPGGQVSYPLLFERRPGEIWIVSGFAFRKFWEEPFHLGLKIDESTFLSLAQEASGRRKKEPTDERGLS